MCILFTYVNEIPLQVRVRELPSLGLTIQIIQYYTRSRSIIIKTLLNIIWSWQIYNQSSKTLLSFLGPSINYLDLLMVRPPLSSFGA